MNLYVIEIDHPLKGPTLVGQWFGTKATAVEWTHFVRAAYHGIPTRVRSFTREQAEVIQANGGQEPTE